LAGRASDEFSTVDVDSLLNFRQIVSFFLGAVFLSSLGVMKSSGFLQSILARFLLRVGRRQQIGDPERFSEKSADTDNRTITSMWNGQNRILLFILSFCLASASISHFVSLLSFGPGSSTACAFVVAWGSINAQSARLVGLLAVFLDLRRLGVRRTESLAFTAFLLVGAVFMFVSNAIAPGTIKSFTTPDISLCYRLHSLPTSVPQSLIFISLEAYCTIRVWSLLSPPFLQLTHQLAGFRDIWVLRGCSLLFLELLTVVPTAVVTNILGDFLPFSVGALAVLYFFNFRPVPAELKIGPTPQHSRTEADSTPRSSRRNTTHSAYSWRSAVPRRFRLMSEAANFSNKEWPDIPRSSRSSRTIDSTSARSVHNAVVHTAKREHRSRVTEIDQFPDVPSFPEGTTMASAERTEETEALSQPTWLAAQLPVRVMVRPRLVVMTSPTASSPEVLPAVDSAPNLDGSPLRLTPPNSAGQAPLSPSTLSSLSFRNPASVSAHSHEPRSTRNTVRFSTITLSEALSYGQAINEQSDKSESGGHSAGMRHSPSGRLRRWPTFGYNGRSAKYRPTGFSNPIQSRWSSSNSSHATSNTSNSRNSGKSAAQITPLPRPPAAGSGGLHQDRDFILM
jgi:hypothetical protein